MSGNSSDRTAHPVQRPSRSETHASAAEQPKAGKVRAAAKERPTKKSKSVSAPLSALGNRRNPRTAGEAAPNRADTRSTAPAAASPPESPAGRESTKTPGHATVAKGGDRAEQPIYSTPAKQTADGHRVEILGTLLDGIEEGVAHISTDGVILYANASFAQLFGREASSIKENQTRLKELMSSECWAELDEGLKVAAREPMEGSLRVEDADRRTIRAVRLAMTPVHWKTKTTIKVTASEMTELLEKNRELQEKESSLHALSARIMQLQDEERRRIARDLHDITGQELAVVIMQLMQVARQQRADSEAMKGITDAAGMVRKIEDEIRTLSYVLHPPLLDELGLGAALNWYVEGFTKRSGIAVKVDVQEGLPRLSKEKEIALYRVVQEAMTNVLRHSGSRTARINLSCNREAVTLSVQDEGKGIGRKRFVGSEKQQHGVGITGMRERLEQLGGGIEVRPARQGTEVLAVIPIGSAAPVEQPLSEDDILRVAKALGYSEGAGQAEPAGGAAAPAAPQMAEAQAEAAGRAAKGAATGPGRSRKRILIADDHEVTRQGIRALLQDEEDVEICGEAANGFEAILKAKKLDPDLIIMDLSMPGCGGYPAAARIRKANLRAKVLFFTTYQNQQVEHMARIGGFEGLVQKVEGARDLARGVRAILEGKRFFGGQVMPAEERKKLHPPKADAAGA